MITTVFASAAMLAACTTGRLEYITPQGEVKFACKTEYNWQPSVDQYAVEYTLAYCAKGAIREGNKVVEQRLLELDLSVPEPPQGRQWSFELARQLHKQGRLTDKEYGYLIAYIDLGLHRSFE